MRRGQVFLAGLAGVGLIALAIAWFQRETIARNVIDGTLAEKGVPARYQIRDLGVRTQRLEQVSLGDPAWPDLTADWIEIDTGSYLSGGAVKAVRASGVRLRATFRDGQLQLGALDRLLPPPTDTPFAWPDIMVRLERTQITINSDLGRIGIGINGAGNLADGFRGAVALIAPRLAQGDCAAETVNLSGGIRIVNRRPALVGPVSAARIKCRGITVKQPLLQLDASLSEAGDSWTASAAGGAAAASGRDFTGTSVTAKANIAGNRAKSDGAFELGVAALTGPYLTAGRTSANGSIMIGKDGLSSQGRLGATGLRPDRAMMARVAALSKSGSGTPVAPIMTQLARALTGLGRGSAAQALYSFDRGAGETRISLNGLSATSQSGARLTVAGTTPLVYRSPGGINADARVAITGGGLPDTRISLSGQSGLATIAPLTAKGARLSLAPVRFDYGRGFRLDTVATLDGPLGNGRINGLRAAINIGRGVSPLAGCQTLSYRSLTIASLALDRGALPVCLAGNSARIDRPVFAGRLGSTPIRISGESARIALGNGDFSIAGLAVRLAADTEPSRLDAVLLSGSLQDGGAAGQFDGLSGRLAAVPVLVSQAKGDWAFRQGVLTTQAGLQVSDAASTPRYQPLTVGDFALKLADNQIRATGTARAPKSGIAISNISIDHDLDSGRGHAVLDVPGVDFGQALQPEELTDITKGVIALVKGRVAGRGDINWGPDGVASTGDFGTESMDLAAAFGPVTGLSGRIRLSDLLGLATQDVQTVKLGSINPGIAVLDGEIRYRLLPGLKAEILGGRWPFAGGTLRLEPTIMDLNASAERNLTFTVEGLDAARFIAAMEFENVAATGEFDGKLPMIFDKNGGRIVDGRIVARSGGSLAYIGNISNENIGTLGRFAFDALKSIRYSRLSIDLDGDLGGDVITRVKFAGVNQAPIGGLKPKLPLPVKIRGLTNFPFIFNVTITAKFRQLFDTVRSINDPSILLKREFPKLDLTPVEKDQPVQPSERPPVQ